MTDPRALALARESTEALLEARRNPNMGAPAIERIDRELARRENGGTAMLAAVDGGTTRKSGGGGAQVAPYNARPSEDMDRVAALLGNLCGGGEIISMVALAGEPFSKARPRFSRSGRAYNSDKQRASERELRAALQRLWSTPVTGNLGVACLFVRSSRQRIDVDNMVKQVLDAANGVCWLDDSQVTAVCGVVEYDPEQPRTVMAVARHASTMDRTPIAPRTCETCGRSYVPQIKGSSSRFCSTACASRSRGEDLRTAIPCPVCGQPFKRRSKDQHHCSRACAYEAMSKRARPVSHCVDCGKELAKPGFARCRACWRDHIRKRGGRVEGVDIDHPRAEVLIEEVRS